ncbi:MAG: hypothetical protein WCC37_27100, partial [Candidatus Sulfotelmatobacter sp.]
SGASAPRKPSNLTWGLAPRGTIPKPVIPTEARAPARAQWRNLLSAAAPQKSAIPMIANPTIPVQPWNARTTVEERHFSCLP